MTTFRNFREFNPATFGYMILVFVFFAGMIRVEMVAREQASAQERVSTQICAAVVQQNQILLRLVQDSTQPVPIPDTASPELKDHLESLAEGRRNFSRLASELLSSGDCTTIILETSE